MPKRIFSGIQPSGVLHLGNYLGAIKSWVALQEKPARNASHSDAGGYDPIFCVVDLHAITVHQKPDELRQKTLEVAKTYLAAGIDPEKSLIFVQSHVPEPFIVKEGMRIMGLDDPKKKMSKSALSEYNYISLTDTPEKIREKIKKSVTDSGKEIKYSADKPAIKNLINIYALLDNAKPKEIVESYQGKGYAEFKKDLAEVVVGFLEPFQEKYNNIEDREVLRILEEGREKAKKMAEEKMEKIREKIGLL